MEVSLKVTRPKGGTKTFQVSKPEIVVGRGKECDMQILSTEVSRRHCQLNIGDDGVSIQDLGSGNGTSVNGLPIQANLDIPLSPGSRIEIGPLKIVVKFTPPVDKKNDSATVPAAGDGTVINEDLTDAARAAAETRDEIPIPAGLSSRVSSAPEPPAAPSPKEQPQEDETLDEIKPVSLTSGDMAASQQEPHEEFEPAAAPEAVDEGDPLEMLEPADEGDGPVITADTIPTAAVIETGPVPVAAASADEGSSSESTAEPEKKSGGLKSLFGLMGRGKKKTTAEDPASTPLPEAEPVAAVVPRAEVLPAVTTPADPAAGAPAELEADIDDGMLEELEEEFDEEELQELLAGEGLEEVSETMDVPIVGQAPPPPADPGLADFLNQIGKDS